MNVQPILGVVGVVLTILGFAMLVPAAVEAGARGPDGWAFAASAGITLFFGVLLTLVGRSSGVVRLSVRQTFVLTNAVWLCVAVFAALPLHLSSVNLSVADAVFEAMSGLTTTGSTVIVGLDHAPRGVLLWRGITQWLGGIGIIVMAMAVLPVLHVAGMSLFQSESSERSEKVLPHWAQIVRVTAQIYVALSALCATAYWALGMSGFDAVVHAMTTLSTGGFASADSSFAIFQSPAIEWTAVVFMIAGGMPFVFYIQLVTHQREAALANSQVRGFLALLVLVCLVLSAWLALTRGMAWDEALRLVSFNAVSVVTTTGFISTDYTQWGAFAVVAFFFLTFVGGCTGSTAGGIKIFHFQILFAVARVQIRRLFHPHGVFVPRYGGKPIPDPVFVSVLSFLLLYVLSFAGFSLGLALFGLDLTTALSGAATALANVGPGLGDIIGPAGSFAPLPDGAKWLLSLAMLMGRLEFFTVLVLLAPSFWRA